MSFAWYLDLRLWRTEASLRYVRLDMSSHFSNLGGLTWQKVISEEIVLDSVSVYLLDLFSLEHFLIVSDRDLNLPPGLCLQQTLHKATVSIRDPEGLLGIVGLGHVFPLHLEGEEEVGGGVRVLAVRGAFLLVSGHAGGVEPGPTVRWAERAEANTLRVSNIPE